MKKYENSSVLKVLFVTWCIILGSYSYRYLQKHDSLKKRKYWSCLKMKTFDFEKFEKYFEFSKWKSVECVLHEGVLIEEIYFKSVVFLTGWYSDVRGRY